MNHFHKNIKADPNDSVERYTTEVDIQDATSVKGMYDSYFRQYVLGKADLSENFLEGISVVLLDDDETIGELYFWICKMFRAKIAVVQTFHDAREAYEAEMLTRQYPHAPVFISDGKIQGTVSKTVLFLQELKQTYPEAPLCLISGSVELFQEAQRKEQYECPFDLCLEKPVGVQEFVCAVKALSKKVLLF